MSASRQQALAIERARREANVRFFQALKHINEITPQLLSGLNMAPFWRRCWMAGKLVAGCL